MAQSIVLKREQSMKNIGERYLEMVGIKRHHETVRFINELIENHLEAFSFNNIDVFKFQGKKLLALDTESLFQKIVVEKRGGYCFEQNKLMYEVLKSLGFDVTSKLGRVVYNKNVDAPRTHRMTVLELDGQRYLIDVGFGAYTPNCMVPFSGEKVDVLGEKYYIVRDQNSYKLIADRREESSFVYYVFDLNEYTESDFFLGNFYTNTYSESKFVKDLIVAKKNKNRILFITEGKFVKLESGKRTEENLSSKEDIEKALHRHFGAQLSILN